ncbi:MAG: hypothetical protein U5R31_05135 [Acidimicrobiia bacterium]|nr:hypothetical protein [Acidimicrobiia bacterium]
MARAAGLEVGGPAEDPAATTGDELADRLDAATAEVTVSDERLKAVRTAVFNGFQDLEADLGSAWRPELDEDDGVLVVRVTDDDGPRSVVAFAERIGAACDDQAARCSPSASGGSSRTRCSRR